MAFNDTALSQTHTITRLSIQSNTQISAKATTIISNLSANATQQEDQDQDPTKPPIIILRAQSRWASKLISIVEIAKRNLAESPPPTTTTNGSSGSSGIEIFQYSSLSSEMVEIERRKPKQKGGLAGAPLPGGAGEGEGEGSDDEGAFQTMGTSSAAAADGEGEGGMKKRAVPVLTVYLAVKPVKALRSEFGWVFRIFSFDLHFTLFMSGFLDFLLILFL
jgi:hypothetical protein